MPWPLSRSDRDIRFAAVATAAATVLLAGELPSTSRFAAAPGVAAAPSFAAAATRASRSEAPVLAMGLFPLEDMQGSLSLVFESIEVTPKRDGCEVRREYRIRCKGTGGSYRLATALLGPDRGPSGIDSTVAISVDGAPQDLLLYESRLVDRGGFVEMSSASDEEIGECWRKQTGEICGHTWAEVTLPIRRNEIRTVELYYRYAAPAPDSALAFALAHASVYTESFWHNSPIPRIELRLDPRALALPAARWTFASQVGRESIVDYRNEGGVLVGHIRNCRTWKGAGHRPEQVVFSSP